MLEDNISAETIAKGLETRVIGRRILYYPSLPSTMDIARQEARLGATEGTTIIAGEQTAGRGRLSRTWLTPGGNIALSVILYPRLALLPSMVMLASLAVVYAIESAAGLKPAIKWPNDILINGKKVCGILIENDLKGDKVNYSIIGIGINVNFSPAGNTGVQYPATSLAAETGGDVSRPEVIRSLLVEMERFYLVLSAGGSVFEDWRDNLETLGKKVRITAGEEVYEGVAESVARDGSLLLRGQDGRLMPILVGDVSRRE